jgi:hypothetical protein
LRTGRTVVRKRSGTSVGASVGEGTAVGTAVAVGEGEAVLGEVPVQSRVWTIAASEEARTAARSRVIRFSYGRAEPEISFQSG